MGPILNKLLLVVKGWQTSLIFRTSSHNSSKIKSRVPTCLPNHFLGYQPQIDAKIIIGAQAFSIVPGSQAFFIFIFFINKNYFFIFLGGPPTRFYFGATNGDIYQIYRILSLIQVFLPHFGGPTNTVWSILINHNCSYAVFAHEQILCESLPQRYYYGTLQKDSNEESTPKDDCITNVKQRSKLKQWMMTSRVGWYPHRFCRPHPGLCVSACKHNCQTKTGTHKVIWIEVTVCQGDILICQKAYTVIWFTLNHPYGDQQNLAPELSQNLAVPYPRDILFHGNRIIGRHVRRQHQDEGDWEQTHQGLRDDAMGQVFKVSPNDAPHLGQDDTPIPSTIPSLARVWGEMVSSPFWGSGTQEFFLGLPLQIWKETPPGRCSLRGCASAVIRDLGHFDCFGLLPFFNWWKCCDWKKLLRLKKKCALTCQVYKGTFGHIATGRKLLQKKNPGDHHGTEKKSLSQCSETNVFFLSAALCLKLRQVIEWKKTGLYTICFACMFHETLQASVCCKREGPETGVILCKKERSAHAYFTPRT